LPSGWTIAAHATAGIVRLWRDAAPDISRVSETLVRSIEREREALREAGGSVHIVTAAALRERDAAWTVQQPLLGMMQSLKRAFDPANILAPGRFRP
jgi:hypothetical protein